MKTRWCWAACCLLACGHSDRESLADSGAPSLAADASANDASLLDAGAVTLTDAAALPDAFVLASDAGTDAGEGGLPTFTRIQDCNADNAAKLSASEVDALRAAHPSTSMPWLYPSEGTVFPRGLRAPLLMWQSATPARAVYVSIKSEHFEYEGCLVPKAKGQLALPEEVWRKAGEQGFGKGDPFQVELRELTAQGSVGGAAHTRFIIAPGSLKGSIYYNSYSSRLAAQQGAPGGAILRVRAGKDAEVFLGQRGCVGCHAVSANGTRLVTSNLGVTTNNEGVYRLAPNTPVNPPSLRKAIDFVGLAPDGAVYATGLSNYTPDVAPGLYETDTGTQITNSQYPSEALHPMFSTSGSLLTYVDNPVDAQGLSAGRVSVMDYDPSKRRLANTRAVVDQSALRMVDWPSFLPDNRAIIYADTARNRLLLVDLASKQSLVLWHATGLDKDPGLDPPPSVDPNRPIDPNDPSSFPPVEPIDRRDAYYPTVAPVAVGGYYWVFFDSFRPYGNVNTSQLPPLDTSVAPQLPPPDPQSDVPDWLRDLLGLGPKPNPNPNPNPTPDPIIPIDAGPPPEGPPSRQLWGTAIEIAADGSYRADPSSPAFYLDGQELGTNNHRAFAALDPCTVRGGGCQSGIDCCDGFCEKGMCVAPPPRCAKIEEACHAHGDCCDSKNLCINGFCSVVAPILQ